MEQSKRNASRRAIPRSVLKALIDQLQIKRSVEKKKHAGGQGSLKSQLTDYHPTQLKGDSKGCQRGCPRSLPRARCCRGENILRGWGTWRFSAHRAEDEGMEGQLCTSSPSVRKSPERCTGRSLWEKKKKEKPSQGYVLLIQKLLWEKKAAKKKKFRVLLGSILPPSAKQTAPRSRGDSKQVRQGRE